MHSIETRTLQSPVTPPMLRGSAYHLGIPLMHGLLRTSCCLVALGLSSALPAASIYRCADSQGHVSFSDQACPPGAAQNALSPQINSLPPPKPPRPDRRTDKSGLVIGSSQSETPCGVLLTSQQKRTARIRQQVLAGMNQQDIESAFGTPDKISRNNNQTRYHYRDAKGNTRQVVFDEAGCVKAKP
jgi:hypothetical protein